MDPLPDLQTMSLPLIDDSARLQQLTSSLDLHLLDKLSIPRSAFRHPVLLDYIRLRDHVRLQEKLCLRYGLDNAAFDLNAFRRLQGIACHLAALPRAFEAYCQLKSQLFLEQNDFLDAVIQGAEARMATDSAGDARSNERAARLMLVVLRIRDAYDAIL